MPNHDRAEIYVGARLICLATGSKSQTINICDGNNRLGNYEEVFRNSNPNCFISSGEIRACTSLTELRTLAHHAGFVSEGARRRS
jgi:hypothetical protein